MKRIKFLFFAIVMGCLGLANDVMAEDSIRLLNEANRALQDGNLDEAIAIYESAESLMPGNHRLAYNKGVALYRKGEIESAQQLFTSAINTDDPGLAASASFNLGNCHYSKAIEQLESDSQAAVEQLKASIKHYRSSLQLNSADSDARANIELAQKLLSQLNQEQEQQNDEQQNSNQQNEEQQNEEQQNEEQQNEDQQNEDQQNQGAENSGSENQEKSGADDQEEQDQPAGDQQTEQDQSEQEQAAQENVDQQNPDQEFDPTGTENSDTDSPESDQTTESQQDTNPSSDQNEQNSEEKDMEQTGEQQANRDPAQADPGQTAPNQDDPQGDDGNTPTTSGYSASHSGELDGNIDKEEAMKMLQAIRDRDLMRRMQKLNERRRRHVPVDRDW